MVFGTRPEAIKLAPVIRALNKWSESFRCVVIATGQHTDLVEPLIKLFGFRVDHNLALMQPGQSPNTLSARAMLGLETVLTQEKPDVVLVQGDTSSALAAALAAFHLRIPVGHIEAGLRTGEPNNPFPEEMNRRLITQLATWHFAPTSSNRRTLLGEGVPNSAVFVTGNTVVDALLTIRRHVPPSMKLTAILQRAERRRLLVVTMHRRENLGAVMVGCLEALHEFVERHGDVELVFPVHPNPAVRSAAQSVLGETPRVQLVEPLDYADFLALVSQAWLIASDSGGIQEEAPTLRKPLLILRETTERPEAVRVGAARLIGTSPRKLAASLEAAYADDSWHRHLRTVVNPFGRGDSAVRIITALAQALGVPLRKEAA
ncbi:MAG: UDP-N-acetylglucosamine 2-epimerase (non-hydrolyzing) [Gemmatales bacterium]|nr:UDP-N-acetylglucosamine 2-epimerase (non-hydrolyzing) [Gemmatales bacterium]MDW8388121.1 UDP-N-acetylglucosamine 2-epimerase (non-hydrolyzing) [Gemmatales bacterium]